jgi:hypothetical protein
MHARREVSMKSIKSLVLSTAVAGLLAAGAAGPAAARPNQVGTAAGVVAAVVQVDRTLNDLEVLSDIGSIEIVTVKRSLNNVLNNSPILSNNVITVQDFLQDCSVAGCIEIRNVLNNNNVAISDVVAIDILSGGDITVFVMPQ